MVVWPLVKGHKDSRDDADFDIEVFQDQLSEIEREQAGGQLDKEEADAARSEVSRRILVADSARKPQTDVWKPRRPLFAGAIIMFLTGATFTFYQYFGSPNQPAQPFAQRMEDRQENLARNTGSGMDLRSLADRLKNRLNEVGGDPQGWLLLARTYMTMGNFNQAILVFQRLISRKSTNPGVYAAYGEAIVLAAEGRVTPKSRKLFREALGKDPKEPTSRYYLALADWQLGLYRKAYDQWVSLLAESAADAPWADVTQQRLLEASEKLDINIVNLPRPLASSKMETNTPRRIPDGPTGEDIRAAQNMSAGDRQNMIRGMVEGLAAKLDDNPSNFEGWKRLIRSYVVLGDIEKAKSSLTKALTQFDKAPFVKRELLSLGRELSLTVSEQDSSSTVRGPTGEDIRAAQNMSAGDRQNIIRGMVEGLTARLKNNPDDLQGWISLARSYNVLGNHMAAREAMRKATTLAPKDIGVLTLYAGTIRVIAGNRPTEESSKILKKVLSIEPNNVEALYFLGLAAANSGDKVVARRLWLKAQSGMPRDSNEYTVLQQKLVELGE